MQISILDLIGHAGPVAKFVLAMLVFASIHSWAIIFAKWRILRGANSENESFLDAFWKSRNIDEIFGKSEVYKRSPVAAVFRSGVKELRKFTVSEFTATEQTHVENVHRALSRATNSEIAALEKGVSWLATIASGAPFVGLFGTVWGIMDSFGRIGASGSANLAIVAPGISEALIATAMGIGAAIPAVVAYNHFASQIKRQAIDMDNFTQDLINIIQRSIVGKKK